MADARRVLCYSPYTFWPLHGRWEMTILHALRLRGADVRYVLCDGLYSECDLFRAAVLPRPPLACAQCQAQVTGLAANMGTAFEWLGRYTRPEDFREAQRWSSALPPREFPRATYGEWPVGEWMKASVHGHFRVSELDLGTPELVDVYRSYLSSGLSACFGLSRLLDDYAADVLFLFNGTMSSTRVAFELAQRRGIRVICHERGDLRESIKLYENGHLGSLTPIKRLWSDWGEIPLTRPELTAIGRYLVERQYGKNLGWPAYSPPPQELDELRQRLGLRPGRPLWVLYTSADDEVASHPDWHGPFARQLEWVERTRAYAAAHPAIDLIVRVHPNTAGTRAHGANARLFGELESLAQALPPNVRVVMPDDPVSSYSLIDLATLGLVYHSTVAVEIACKGKPVIVAAGGPVSDLPFAITLKAGDAYEATLDRARSRPFPMPSLDTQRLAHRFAYRYFFGTNVPFPLVNMTPTPPQLAYRSLDDLVPGREPNLDRIARILLEAEPVCPPPTAEDRLRGDTDELLWFNLGPAAGAPRLHPGSVPYAAAGSDAPWREQP